MVGVCERAAAPDRVERPAATVGDVPLVGVRYITSQDMAWMRGLFTRRYPNNYDATTTEQWMREIVLRGPMQFQAVRTDDALCISLCTSYPWLPNDKEVSVIVILADLGKMWQTLPLLR